MSHDFAQRFAIAWRNPSPERLAALLRQDVVLYQPHLPPIRGIEAVMRENRRLFAWVPQLHSITGDSRGDDDVLYIEHVLTLPVGRDAIRIPCIDRFRLVDGLAAERTVYFDQVRMIAGVLRHPSLWAGFLKYRYGPG